MGFNLRPQKKAISDINVTPFVDVVLVLLVIFMLTAPLMYNGIKLELPKTKKVNTLKLSSTQVILSMSPTGEFYMGKDKYLIVFRLSLIVDVLLNNIIIIMKEIILEMDIIFH
ncbi:MAG: biopolymer transporter ExbD [Oligoflexia bacterium]|nr:biopolymer transporter ExbD [Oligoflexia bacterium]